MEPGDKAAGQHRQRDERDHRLGGAAPAPRCAARASRDTGEGLCKEAEGDPQRRGIDQKRQGEMGDEPVLADLDPVGEAAFDHVPAERALQEAEHEDAGERHQQMARHPPAQREIEERQGVGKADQPPPQAVDVFPEVDGFEVGEAHARS